jgi:dTDP-glucose pyrophosphorylase
VRIRLLELILTLTLKQTLLFGLKVDQPEAYGVVKLNDANEIVELVEKPQDFVSDLAVIGIYYFKEVRDFKGRASKCFRQQHSKWWRVPN